jgi:two-component system, chemotaxis family, sensor kinase CheA
MNELHDQFITEGRELIQQATDDLIALESEDFAFERIDRIFRAFHTLKGSAGVVDLPSMALSLHAAEDLLAAIHGGRLQANTAIVDQALACLDQVSGWIDAFETHAALPGSAGEEARVMAERLRALLAAPGRVPASSHEKSASAVPEWATRLLAVAHTQIVLAENPAAVFAVSYEPRPDCFFDGDDPLDLMRRLPRLLALKVEPRSPWPPLAELDPYACNLRIEAIAAGTREQLTQVFRLVPDQIRIIDIPAGALAPVVAEGRGDNDLIAAVIEEQRQMLGAGSKDQGLPGRIAAAARVAANALRHAQRPDLVVAIELAAASAASAAEAGPLLAALNATLVALSQDEHSVTDDEAAEPTARAASRSLRVDETRIDALVNLAGELTILKNRFAHLAKRAEDDGNGREIAGLIRRETEALDRLASEMRGAILQLRMVPVAQIFRSFPRLVRDISQRLGKKVALVTRGETTESDKTIVDHLFEPMLHLVRNALDHGIETPNQRAAVGKPEAATLTIQASRTGDRFIVEVIDDGRGIDPEMVRRRALERRLLPANELSVLQDEQVVDLIFAAGFSTADAVSDISGRGVGMDVVRNTIEQIGGRVTLSSRVGHGTTVSLDLPLNIAMLRIMIVEAGGQVFGIPMDAVTKTVRLTPDLISTIKNNDGFVLDDRIVPICSLAELMNLPRAAGRTSGDRLAVVAETVGKIAALEVDAIRDRQEVVLKPLQGVLANAHGYAGTTLLGDGGVLLVLDLKEIVP